MAISSGTCRSALNRKHTLVHIDGTFKTSPKYFTQIWIVSGYVGSTCVPFMYILIEDKTCSLYSKAIEVLKSYCPDFDSDSFMVDFEKAEHSAIRSHFIDAIIKGCLFHWKQCLNRKFKAVVGYEDNELLRNDLHTVFGLAFVPVDDVLHGWSLLKPLLMQYPDAAPFIDYFQKNWLYNRSYPISMWNCYEATLSDDPRTNNQAEGNNNALNTAAGCSSPTIYRLMDILKGFNAESELKILQTTTGLQATRKPRNNTIKMKERVKKTVQNYRRENIVLQCRFLDTSTFELHFTVTLYPESV